MKRSRFEEWLSTLKLLSEEQRRLLLRELGVDELHDPHAGSGGKFGVASQPAANEIVDEKSADSSIGAGSLASGDDGLDFVSEIGRKRILRSGCPHCGTDEVRSWGLCQSNGRSSALGAASADPSGESRLCPSS